MVHYLFHMKLLLCMVFTLLVQYSYCVENEDVTVSYTVWYGTDVSDSYTTQVTAKDNSTLFQIMKIAESRDRRFAFNSICTKTGRLVNSIGIHNWDPENNEFWLIYNLPTLPNINHPPTSEFLSRTGLENTFIKDGDNYLLWLRDIGFLGGTPMIFQIRCPEYLSEIDTASFGDKSF